MKKAAAGYIRFDGGNSTDMCCASAPQRVKHRVNPRTPLFAPLGVMDPGTFSRAQSIKIIDFSFSNFKKKVYFKPGL